VTQDSAQKRSFQLDFHQDPGVLQLVIDSVAEGVFTVNDEGIIQAWNAGAERITGYLREEVVGKPCLIMDGPHCNGFGKVYEIFRNKMTPPPEITAQCKALSKDRRELYIQGHCKFLFDSAGKVLGAVGSFADLTHILASQERLAALEGQSEQETAFEGLVGKSKPMQEVFRRIQRAARSDVTVLVSGESGTGKELAVRALHSLSDRRDGPFLCLNCSAIPETLLESELFGHLRGAFTGAVADKVGLFESARGGTLFLDEIGDVSPALQVKLLRVLEEKETRRVGDNRVSRIDVRLVTATNRNLKERIASGAMREDFYYRIRVYEIPMPAVRERGDDILLLTRHFVNVYAKFYKRTSPRISPEAMDRIRSYAWPGNVRELRHAIEHAFVSAAGEIVEVSDMPPEIAACAVACDGADERAKVEQALKQCAGNRTKAAKKLGISRVALWKRLKRLGIDG
jgi:two-component system, NtrC family, response regulator HydG